MTMNEDRIGSCRRWGDVLMMSVVAAGHVTPLMHVAKGLMDRGISITVVIPEDERAMVEKTLESKYTEAAGGLMSFELVKSLSKLKEKDGGMSGISTNVQRACEPLLQQLLADQESGSVQLPKCIVSDQFLWWTQVWADKLGISRYVSFPSPTAYALTMLFYGPIEDQLEHAPDKEDPDLVIDLPQLPLELHRTDLPKSILHGYSFGRKVVKNGGDTLKDAAGILFNTFYELESAAIDSFQAKMEMINPPGKVTKLLPVGPMLPPAFFKEGQFDGETKSSKCLEWLDTRPASSVLYIAFGSWAYLSPKQIQDLAQALEATQVSFLWILRVEGSKKVSQLLPPGFCDRVKDRGLVYSEFAPQLQILSHSAIRGFLTHCGWNSSLESICRGVPMIGWPMQAEQGLCCRVLVELAKVAVEIHRGGGGLVTGDDIERALKILMKEPQGHELKQRAVELQHLARAAVAPGGSSRRNFESFVEDIRGQP